jgi:hypothetical protein
MNPGHIEVLQETDWLANAGQRFNAIEGDTLRQTLTKVGSITFRPAHGSHQAFGCLAGDVDPGRNPV